MPAFISIQQNLETMNPCSFKIKHSMKQFFPQKGFELIVTSGICKATSNCSGFFLCFQDKKDQMQKNPKQTTSLHNPSYKKYIVLQLSLPSWVSPFCPLFLEIMLSFHCEQLLDSHFMHLYNANLLIYLKIPMSLMTFKFLIFNFVIQLAANSKSKLYNFMGTKCSTGLDKLIFSLVRHISSGFWIKFWRK